MLELALYYATINMFPLCLGHVTYAFEVPAHAFKQVFQLIRWIRGDVIYVT